MCELFAVSGENRIRVNEYLRVFFSHSTEHPDGWGYVTFDESGYHMIKEPVPAYKSTLIREMLEKDIDEANMFAHIRQATRGDMVYENCHPFAMKDMAGTTWILSHNGTIFDYPGMDKYREKQKGSTDSERILFYLIDKINEKCSSAGHPLTSSERFETVDGVICDITRNNNKVNLMLWDGEYIYVHTNLRNSLYMKNEKGSVIFSTQPLDASAWENVPFTRLLVYKEGRLVFTGTNHGNEHIDE